MFRRFTDLFLLLVVVVITACSAAPTPAPSAGPSASISPAPSSSVTSAPGTSSSSSASVATPKPSASSTAAPSAQTPKRGGSLVLGTLNFPSTLDATTTTQRAAWLAMSFGCEGLFTVDAQLGVQSALVDSWKYDATAMTYTFKLRSGVLFQDGSTLKAQDVVASLNRFAKSATGSTFAPLLDTLTVTDDLTVVLKLKSSSAAIPALLATPDSAAFIMSAASVADKPATTPLTSFVCTGPYQVSQFQPDQSILFKRFDKYVSRTEKPSGGSGAKNAYLDEIKVVPVNVANVMNSVATGAIDIVFQFPLDQYKSATSNPNVQVLITQYSQQPVLILNMKAGIMTNPTIRKAVLYALGPEPMLLTDAGDPSLYQLNVSWFPPGSPWYSEAGSSEYNHRDVAKAKSLLAQAGYKNEPIRILDPQTVKSPAVIEQQLKEAGFNVQRILVDNATYTQRRTQPEEWDAFTSGGTNYADPLTVVFVNPSFPGWWDTPEKKSIMAQLTSEPEAAKRKAAWDQLQTLMWDQVPWVRHGSVASLAVASKRVKGLEATLGSMPFLQNVWIGQ